MLVDPKQFPEPGVFNPDRFLPENKKKIASMAYIPFGFAGKRVCPGKTLAYTEVSTCFNFV
eukprot:m.254833 g.254833  ORF g.254833 m.254833 type:complete len:61 (+) comp16178_c1_seq19:211-393(+)